MAKKIGVEMEEGASALIARKADGAMRDALSLLDQATSMEERFLTLSAVDSIAGTVDEDLMFPLVDALIDRDMGSALRRFDEIVGAGKSPGAFVSELVYHYRNLLMARASDTENLIRKKCGASFGVRRIYLSRRDRRLPEITLDYERRIREVTANGPWRRFCWPLGRSRRSGVSILDGAPGKTEGLEGSDCSFPCLERNERRQ